MPTSTSIVSRLLLNDPDFGYDPLGTDILHTLVRSLHTKLGDNINSRFFVANALAAGASIDFTHNFKCAFADLRYEVANRNTSTGEMTRLSGVTTPTLAQITVAAKTGLLTTAITVTNTSGAPVDIAISVVYDPASQLSSRTETLINKTLAGVVISDYLDMTDIASPAAPSAGRTRVYSKSGQLYKQTATLAEQLIGSGGSGSKNYLQSTANTAVGWLTTGTSTVATTTTAANLPEPSVGSGLLFTLSQVGSVNAIRWTVDPSDYGRLQELKFALKALAGYVGGNAKLELYSNTASNYSGTSTKLPLRYDNSSGVSSISTAPNQVTSYTAYDAAPYLELRVVTVVATGSFVISSLSTGPGVSAQGPSVGNWQSYVPTFAGLGTVTGINAQYKINTDSIELLISATTGTPTAVLAMVTLPNSWTINDAVTGTIVRDLGTWQRNNAVNGDTKTGLMIRDNVASPNFLYFSVNDKTTAAGVNTAQNGNAILQATQFFEIRATVPITQLANNAVVNIVQNEPFFYFNSALSGTSDSTSFGYGSMGGPFPNATPSGGLISRRIRLSRPLQSNEYLITEISTQGDGRFVPAIGRIFDAGITNFAIEHFYLNASIAAGTYVGISQPRAVVGAPLDYDVDIGKYSASQFGSASSPDPWTLPGMVNARWRVRVVSGSVGAFGEQIPGVSAGLVSAQGVTGRTNGLTPPSDKVSFSIKQTLSIAGPVTSGIPFNIGSFVPPAGRWKCVGFAGFGIGTGTGITYVLLNLNTVSADIGVEYSTWNVANGVNPSGPTFPLFFDTDGTKTLYLVGQYNYSAIGNSGYNTARVLLERC